MFQKIQVLLIICVLGILPLDLQTIHQRIKDNVDVLSNFSTKREAGKERAEYIALLKKDLCTYYSYNIFLIEKIMDLFPLSEVSVVLWHQLEHVLIADIQMFTPSSDSTLPRVKAAVIKFTLKTEVNNCS